MIDTVNSASWFHELVRIALGMVLLSAAGMKSYELAISPVIGNGIFSSRWLRMGIVDAEAIFGVWMLSGLSKQKTRYIALACFTVFFCVSLVKALAGASSCGCFGTISINPWHSLSFDIAAIGALWYWIPCSPSTLSPSSKKIRFGIVLLASLGVVTGGVFLMARGWRNGQFAGSIVILEPETWQGKRFALLGHTDIDDQISVGKWVVLLYHHDCAECRKVVARYQQRAFESDATTKTPSIALLELPPYQPVEKCTDKNVCAPEDVIFPCVRGPDIPVVCVTFLL